LVGRALMSGSFFVPPQAYTRSDLVKAFEWVKTQPKVVQERARDADSLVGLYLHARRQNLSPSRNRQQMIDESSPSAEAFREDLKSLSEAFKEFEPSSETTQDAIAPPQEQMESPVPIEEEVLPPPPHQKPAQASIPQGLVFDNRTLNSLREAQERLNLGSESDALRVLVQLGLEKLKTSLPQIR